MACIVGMPPVAFGLNPSNSLGSNASEREEFRREVGVGPLRS